MPLNFFGGIQLLSTVLGMFNSLLDVLLGTRSVQRLKTKGWGGKMIIQPMHAF